MIDMIVVQSPPRLACLQKAEKSIKAEHKAPAEISEISAHAQDLVISNISLRHALGPTSALCPPILPGHRFAIKRGSLFFSFFPFLHFFVSPPALVSLEKFVK